MKVTFDIRVLGWSLTNPRARTGVFRAVENLARELVASPACELQFYGGTSGDDLSACMRYLELCPPGARVPLLFSKLERLRESLQERQSVDLPPISGLLRGGDLADRLRGLALWKRVLRRLAPYGGRALALYGRLAAPLALDRADVFHSPFLAFPEQLARARHPAQFLTIYDLAPIVHPRFCSPDQKRMVEEALAGLSEESWVICASQATKDDLCAVTGMDPDRAFVTHLAASPQLFHPCTDMGAISAVREKVGIPPGPYLLSLNTIEPRKNVGQVIAAFARLAQECRALELSLVLVGARGWQGQEILETMSQHDRLRGRIITPGYVADQDLAALYSGALAFVYPSFYEGFGLPPLEAMQCGTPVITSNTSSLPEVVGDAGTMVDPTDTEGLCQGLYAICTRSALREAMSQRALARAREFTWQKCARQTIEAYQAAL